MSLSQRIRPNSEAAPWVVDAVEKLEKELSCADSFYRLAIKERDFERVKNKKLIDALSKISLAEKDTTSSAAEKMRDCARIARQALNAQ